MHLRWKNYKHFHIFVLKCCNVENQLKNGCNACLLEEGRVLLVLDKSITKRAGKPTKRRYHWSCRKQCETWAHNCLWQHRGASGPHWLGHCRWVPACGQVWGQAVSFNQHSQDCVRNGFLARWAGWSMLPPGSFVRKRGRPCSKGCRSVAPSCCAGQHCLSSHRGVGARHAGPHGLWAGVPGWAAPAVLTELKSLSLEWALGVSKVLLQECLCQRLQMHSALWLLVSIHS